MDCSPEDQWNDSGVWDQIWPQWSFMVHQLQERWQHLSYSGRSDLSLRARPNIPFLQQCPSVFFSFSLSSFPSLALLWFLLPFPFHLFCNSSSVEMHHYTSIRKPFFHLQFHFNFFLNKFFPFLFLTVSQCDPWGRCSHEAVLQRLLHRHPQETGQDCWLHLWPLLSDQWETWEENWWGLERHDRRGKSFCLCVWGCLWFCLSAFLSNVVSLSALCHLCMR